MYYHTIPQYCRAFLFDRLDIIPSMVLQGRFLNRLYSDRTCPYGLNRIDTSFHVFLECRLFERRDHYIKALFDQSFPYTVENLSPLLSYKDLKFTLAVAKCFSPFSPRVQNMRNENLLLLKEVLANKLQKK